MYKFFNNLPSPYLVIDHLTYKNVAELWEIFFMDNTTPQVEGLEEFHNNIIGYLVIALLPVFLMVLSLIWNNKGKIFKYIETSEWIKLICSTIVILTLVLMAVVVAVLLILLIYALFLLYFSVPNTWDFVQASQGYSNEIEPSNTLFMDGNGRGGLGRYDPVRSSAYDNMRLAKLRKICSNPELVNPSFSKTSDRDRHLLLNINSTIQGLDHYIATNYGVNNYPLWKIYVNNTWTVLTNYRNQVGQELLDSGPINGKLFIDNMQDKAEVPETFWVDYPYFHKSRQQFYDIVYGISRS